MKLHCLLVAMVMCLTSVAQEPDLHAVVAAGAGKVTNLGDGVYTIDRALIINTDNTDIYGHATIVQSNPDADIVRIENAKGVRIEGLTLTRADGKQDATASAVRAEKCSRLQLSDLHVIDNWSQSGTMHLNECTSSVIRDCEVQNYKRICVDDRTATEHYGYAFRVIDGTGILVTFSSDIQILNNRVIDDRLLPTEEVKKQHNLGALCEGKNPTNKGKLAPQGDYANNWHQGSAIVVSSPEATNHVLLSGNLIRNAAQGIDMHCDNVTCSNNVIDHAFIGIKCMHGARNVIIANNNVSHMDLWGIIMMPGTLSHPAEAAKDDKPARGPNFTRGNIIANNVFSDFGFGHEYFNWHQQKSGVISLESGQLAENPVMTDVLVEGNIVYDTCADQVMVDGQPESQPPRYEWSVYLTPEPRPQGIVFRNNIFHPGRGGISNIPLE